MLPRIHKLALRNHFDIFRTFPRLQTPHLRWFVQSTDSAHGQAAIVVPKSVYKKASQRNALKRRMYTALLPILKKNPGIYLVGTVKSTGEKQLFDPYEDIQILHHSLHS